MSAADDAREALGSAWLRDGATLADGIRAKTQWLEEAFARADDDARRVRAELEREEAYAREAHKVIMAVRDWVATEKSGDVLMGMVRYRMLLSAFAAYETWEATS